MFSKWPNIEAWVFENRKVVTLTLFGLLFAGIGLFFWRSGVLESTQVQILGTEQSASASANPTTSSGQIVAEIAGAVLKPGVYHLAVGSRTDDLLVLAGGLSANADRTWVEKNLNRAAKITDGQKIYIPRPDEMRSNDSNAVTQSHSNNTGVVGLVNINSASASELDALPGIGTVRAQSIIKNRPYSSVGELVTKKILPQSVFDKIEGSITAP